MLMSYYSQREIPDSPLCWYTQYYKCSHWWRSVWGFAHGSEPLLISTIISIFFFLPFTPIQQLPFKMYLCLYIIVILLNSGQTTKKKTWYAHTKAKICFINYCYHYRKIKNGGYISKNTCALSIHLSLVFCSNSIWNVRTTSDQNQNMHFTSKLRTFLRIEHILSGPTKCCLWVSLGFKVNI